MRRTTTGATSKQQRGKRQPPKRDQPLCHIDYIIAHAAEPIVTVARALHISEMTVSRIKRELGLPTLYRRRDDGVTPDLIAAKYGWHIPTVAAELEAHGYGGMSMRKVRQLCGS